MLLGRRTTGEADKLSQSLEIRNRHAAAGMELGAGSYGLQAEADCRKNDRYGRNICVVRVNGRDVGLEQIRAGMAWWYRQYARDQTLQEQRVYEDAEEQAKSAKRGLWTDKEPIPPWEWRRTSKNF